MDEVEAFEAEVAGLADAVRDDYYPKALQKITIVEHNAGRARRLATSLDGLLPDHTITTKAGSSVDPASALATEKLRAAGYSSDAKAHVCGNALQG